MEDQLRAEFVDELRVEGINYLGYGLIPKFVMLDKDLSIEAKAIYAYFCSYSGAGNCAFPGRDRILSDLSMSKDAYYKHYNQLIANGYITVTQSKNNSSQFQRNIYTLVNSPSKFKEAPADEKLMEAYLIIRLSGLKGSGFGFIPKALMTDNRLSVKAKGLYSYYSSFTGAGECAFPEKAVVMHHLGIGIHAYEKLNKELLSLNYIEIKQKHVGGRLGVNEIYLVDNPALEKANTKHVREKGEKIQCYRIQDTDIHNEDTLCYKKQDTVKQYTEKQDTEIQDTKNNKIKINKKNNNSLNNQTEAAPDEEWDDNTISFEILKEGTIPSSYLKDPEKLEAAVKVLCNYNKLSKKQRYELFEEGDFLYSSYMLFVDALISMLSDPKRRKIDERTITNETIREKLGRYIEKSIDGEICVNSLITEAQCLYKEASKVTEPKVPLKFMQRMIWNAMVNGTIIADSMVIRDFSSEDDDDL